MALNLFAWNRTFVFVLYLSLVLSAKIPSKVKKNKNKFLDKFNLSKTGTPKVSRKKPDFHKKTDAISNSRNRIILTNQSRIK